MLRVGEDCTLREQHGHSIADRLGQYLNARNSHVRTEKIDDNDCVRIEEVLTATNERRRRYVTLRTGRSGRHIEMASSSVTEEMEAGVTSQTVGYLLRLRVHLQMDFQDSRTRSWPERYHEAANDLDELFYTYAHDWLQQERRRDEQLLHGSNVTSHTSTSTSDVADDCARRGCLERWTAAGKQAKCVNSVFNSTYLKCGECYGNSRNDNVLLHGLCTAFNVRTVYIQCTLLPSA